MTIGNFAFLDKQLYPEDMKSALLYRGIDKAR